MSGQIVAVVGAQYGSEGKGAVAARIGRDWSQGDSFVRVAGPNAGHTAYDANGRRFAFRQLPVASVVNHAANIVIAAGSEIEPAVLTKEIFEAEEAGHPVRGRLLIDNSATLLEDRHKEVEADRALVARVGSTGKGIGAARADRLMRSARVWGEVAADLGLDECSYNDTAAHLNRMLSGGARVMVEGTQGYGLGLHTSNYPQVTSSDCRAIDFLAMAGINPWSVRVRIVLATRVFPIRVAGNSGPLKGETDWAALGLEPERTTVTNKIRRVGSWDPGLVRAAIVANGPASEIALTMLDQYDPAVAGWDGPTRLGDLPPAAARFVRQVEHETGATVTLAGTSPTTMLELR